MKIVNKSAFFNYEVSDKIEAGIQLTGAEVKSLFAGQATIDQAYVKFIGNELFLINAHIHPYKYANIDKIDPKRSRKLLLHKKEIVAIQSKIQQKNLTLIPLSVYNIGHKIKLEIGMARGKKIWEKKDAIKKADIARETEIELKNYK
jgi:SsrA-binding protein